MINFTDQIKRLIICNKITGPMHTIIYFSNEATLINPNFRLYDRMSIYNIFGKLFCEDSSNQWASIYSIISSLSVCLSIIVLLHLDVLVLVRVWSYWQFSVETDIKNIELILFLAVPAEIDILLRYAFCFLVASTYLKYLGSLIIKNYLILYLYFRLWREVSVESKSTTQPPTMSPWLATTLLVLLTTWTTSILAVEDPVLLEYSDYYYDLYYGDYNYDDIGKFSIYNF